MLKYLSTLVLGLAMFMCPAPPPMDGAELEKGGALVKCEDGRTLGFGPFYAATQTPEQRCGEEARAVVAQPPASFVLLFGQQPTNKDGLEGIQLRAARAAWFEQLENFGGLVFPNDLRNVGGADNPDALVNALEAGEIPTTGFTDAEWVKFVDFVKKFTFTQPFVYLTYVENRTHEITGNPNPGYTALLRFVPLSDGPHTLSTTRFLKSSLLSPVMAITGVQRSFIRAGASFPEELLSPRHDPATRLRNSENGAEE